MKINYILIMIKYVKIVLISKICIEIICKKIEKMKCL
jgi:hypothetical protein